jgi:hypothetical protein
VQEKKKKRGPQAELAAEPSSLSLVQEKQKRKENLNLSLVQEFTASAWCKKK